MKITDLLKVKKDKKRQGCQLLPSVLNIKSGDLINTIMNRRKLKVLNIGKVEVKLSLCANDLTVYWKSPGESTELTNTELTNLALRTQGVLALRTQI